MNHNSKLRILKELSHIYFLYFNKTDNFLLLIRLIYQKCINMVTDLSQN